MTWQATNEKRENDVVRKCDWLSLLEGTDDVVFLVCEVFSNNRIFYSGSHCFHTRV